MKAEHPTLPNTEVLTVEQSEHKTEIFGLLCSGVSPARTAALVLQRYGESIPIDDVAEFATHIQAKYFLKQGELQRRVNYLDVEIDTIGEMSAILRYMKDEVEVAILATKLTSGDSNVTSDTRRLVNQYWNMLRRFEELRGELGLVSVAEQPETAPPQTALPSLRDLILQQNLILPAGPRVTRVTKEAFVDAEVSVLDGAKAEGS